MFSNVTRTPSCHIFNSSVRQEGSAGIHRIPLSKSIYYSIETLMTFHWMWKC